MKPLYNKRFEIRLTEEQLKQLMYEAMEQNIKVTQLIRNKLFGEEQDNEISD